MFTKCDFLKYFYGKQYNRCYVNKKNQRYFVIYIMKWP